MFRKVLIANRGEIAVRILAACQELGVSTTAVYSDSDAVSLHVALADEAVRIGSPPPADSYLRGERIIAAALACGCDAIHPGYGFLAENADFAQAVGDAGLTFIGPTPAAMRLMGSKTSARAAMQAGGVPVIPGYQGSQADDDLLAAAQKMGAPVLVKAAAGGGGKGMRVVRAQDDLLHAFQSARREAQNAFGDDRIYLEKLIERPRHIEFQVFGDHHGNVIHLFERECSVQRRHQKIIEETPSPLLDGDLRHRMAAAAVQAARTAGYVNAGTIEFLVDQQRNFYFLEMNTRLQVEHPITEAVTGIDLVKLQLRIAAGEPLPYRQEQISQRGHAVECRVYAEDPANGFLPAIGKVALAVAPVAPGVRVDAGVTTGDEVTLHYDPMIAKVIAYGETRRDALEKMDCALRRYVILGDVVTNLPFLRAVLAHPVFRQSQQSTDFVDRHLAELLPARQTPPAEVLGLAALTQALAQRTKAASAPANENNDGDPFSPWQNASGFRLSASA